MTCTRKTILTIVLVFSVCMVFTVSANAELKIGYIQSDFIFSKYQPYIEAQKQLDEFQKGEMDKLRAKQEDLQKKAQEAKNQELLMTDEMKQAKLEELQQQEMELQQTYEELYRDDGIMYKKQSELLQPIIDQINEVLMRIARDNEYDYIFDATAGPAGGSLLYAAEQYNISDMVLEALEKDISSQ